MLLASANNDYTHHTYFIHHHRMHCPAFSKEFVLKIALRQLAMMKGDGQLESKSISAKLTTSLKGCPVIKLIWCSFQAHF